MKNGDRRGLRNGDFFVGSVRGERWNREPHDVAGFFFDGALKEDAGAVSGPARDAEAYANASELIRMREAADFEDFAVDEVSGFGAVGGNDEAAFVAVERGEFFVGVVEDVHVLEAGRAAHGMVLLDSDSEIHAGKPGDIAKGAALVGRRERAGREARRFDGVERKRAYGVDEIGDGVVVGQKRGVGGAEKEIVAFVDARFVAGVVEEERLDRVCGVAAVGFDRSGEELDGEIFSVR